MPRLLFALALIWTAPALAAEKAALVIDVIGGTTPAVEPFSELGAGAEITLEATAEIIVMHYATCEETHIAGGVVSVGRAALKTSGGASVIAQDKVECPETVAFVEETNASGAVVLRSAGEAAIAPRPVFIAPGATMVELLSGDGVIQARVVGGRAVWPSGAPDLMIGQVYQIRLIGPDGPRVSAAAVRGNAGVAILRYE